MGMRHDHLLQSNPVYEARNAEEETKLRWLMARLLDAAANDARKNGFESAGPRARQDNVLDGMKRFAAELMRAAPTAAQPAPEVGRDGRDVDRLRLEMMSTGSATTGSFGSSDAAARRRYTSPATRGSIGRWPSRSWTAIPVPTRRRSNAFVGKPRSPRGSSTRASAPVDETGEDRGALWIAMRYVEGDTLAKAISTAGDHARSLDTTVVGASESEADPNLIGTGLRAAFRTEVMGGDRTRSRTLRRRRRTLHVAHQNGVIHRDLKPGHHRHEEGDPVILDFGLAQKTSGDAPTLTISGELNGTPAYMSPEQIAAHRIRLDCRTDVYSLGISLYECLTLQRPFDAPTREATYQAIMTKNAPDVRELNPSVSKDLKVVLETAIEKDPGPPLQDGPRLRGGSSARPRPSAHPRAPRRQTSPGSGAGPSAIRPWP